MKKLLESMDSISSSKTAKKQVITESKVAESKIPAKAPSSMMDWIKLVEDQQQFSMEPSPQNSQVIKDKKNNKIVGTVNDPNTATKMKKDIEDGKITLNSDELNEDKDFDEYDDKDWKNWDDKVDRVGKKAKSKMPRKKTIRSLIKKLKKVIVLSIQYLILKVEPKHSKREWMRANPEKMEISKKPHIKTTTRRITKKGITTQQSRTKNHMGETEYSSYSTWKMACRKAGANSFDGDRDICQALKDGKGVGEWDGIVGSVYDNAHKAKKVEEGKGMMGASSSIIGSKLPKSDVRTFGLEGGRPYKLSKHKGDGRLDISTQDKKDHIRSRLGKHTAPVLPEKKVQESRKLRESIETLNHIIRKFKYEVKQFERNSELDHDLFEELKDYYMDHGMMPVESQKAEMFRQDLMHAEPRQTSDFGDHMMNETDHEIDPFASKVNPINVPASQRKQQGMNSLTLDQVRDDSHNMTSRAGLNKVHDRVSQANRMNAFEAWDKQLNSLLSEGLSVSSSTGQEGAPDSVTISATDEDAHQLLSVVRNAGIGVFGGEQESSEEEFGADYGIPSNTDTGEIEVVGGEEPSDEVSADTDDAYGDEYFAGDESAPEADNGDSMLDLIKKLMGASAEEAPIEEPSDEGGEEFPIDSTDDMVSDTETIPKKILKLIPILIQKREQREQTVKKLMPIPTLNLMMNPVIMKKKQMKKLRIL
ncbi:hypothetical protein GHT06_001834 [Daphnia sinensis]|uniref:Uncharacterized protein n=1 Tax=Daphnia sinensis TaxID=1820382 RepID=A0AAD5PLS0_9CRUS|nr:hypothetical protein GHT06_001834 [Daphnia sinensis]